MLQTDHIDTMSSELQNKDFRVLLSTLAEETREKAQEKKGENIERAERKRKKREKDRGEGEETETTKNKDNGNDSEQKKEKEREKRKPKYRNRAEERRKGIIKDVEDEAVLYDNKDNTIDESKFMGGDVEHTHLVKGLDFILLKKVRANLNNANGGQSNFITFGEKREEEKDRLFFDLNNNSVDCKQIYKYFFLLEHPHHKDFRNKVKSISDSIIEKNMKFQHYNRSIHNTFYKCNLNMEVEVNDIPPKYIVESDEVQRITTDYLGNGYLNELEDCFKWHAENKKKKKEDRLPKRTSRFLKNQNMQEEDPDFDIFAKLDTEEEVSSSDDNDDRVEMSSSDDSYSSSDNSASSNVIKRIKVDDNNNNKNTLGNSVEKTSTGLRNHQYNYTKFDISNTVETEEKKNAFENAFRDTYDECYPL